MTYINQARIGASNVGQAALEYWNIAGNSEVSFLVTSSEYTTAWANAAEAATILGISAISDALTAHLNDTTDAHDASAISVVDAGGNFTGADVETVLAELASMSGGAVTADSVTYAGGLDMVATNVESALDELADKIDNLQYTFAEKSDEGHTHDDRYYKLSTDLATQAELDAHINDTTDAHDASAISYAGGTGMSATDVEAAIDELATEKLDVSTAASTYVELAGDTMTGALLLHYASALLEVRASSGDATVEVDSTSGYSYVNLKIGNVIYGQFYATTAALSIGDGGMAAITMIQSTNNVQLGNGFGTLTSLATNPAATDDSDKVATTSWTQDAIDVHRNDTSDAHDASAISIVDAGGYFTGTDVEAALQEVGAATAGTTSVGDVGGLDYVLAEKSDEGHAHDDRYIPIIPSLAKSAAQRAGVVTWDQLEYVLAEKSDEGHRHNIIIPTVTALPTTPTNGQEVYYIADSTNGVYWHLRYDSSHSGSYKWLFLGGPPLRHYIATQELISGAAWVNLATTGPHVTVPLAGDYLSIGKAQFVTVDNLAYYTGSLGVGTGDFAAGSEVDLSYVTAVQATSGRGTISVMGTHTGMSASGVVRLRYGVTTNNKMNASVRSLYVTPVRVG